MKTRLDKGKRRGAARTRAENKKPKKQKKTNQTKNKKNKKKKKIEEKKKSIRSPKKNGEWELLQGEKGRVRRSKTESGVFLKEAKGGSR